MKKDFLKPDKEKIIIFLILLAPVLYALMLMLFPLFGESAFANENLFYNKIIFFLAFMAFIFPVFIFSIFLNSYLLALACLIEFFIYWLLACWLAKIFNRILLKLRNKK